MVSPEPRNPRGKSAELSMVSPEPDLRQVLTPQDVEDGSRRSFGIFFVFAACPAWLRPFVDRDLPKEARR